MIVKNIKKLSSGKYQLNFEDGSKIVTYDEVILKNNLLYKKNIDSADINIINKDNIFYNVYYGAIKFILKKRRSEKEINEFLNKYDLSEKEKIKITDSLKEKNLLNNKDFVKSYIADRINLSNDGPYKIKNDLLKYGISEDEINFEIEKIDRNEIISKLSKLINKKAKTAKGSLYNIKQKIIYEMYNLGYSKEMIDEVYQFDIDDMPSLEKDFNKLLANLKLKEKDSNKLYFKIKQKLYQKGYSVDKIDDIINKKRD